MLLAILPVLLIVSAVAAEEDVIHSNQEIMDALPSKIRDIVGRLISAHGETWGNVIFDLKDSLYTATEQAPVIQAADLTSTEFFKEFENDLNEFMIEIKTKFDTAGLSMDDNDHQADITKLLSEWKTTAEKQIKDSFGALKQSFNTYKTTGKEIFAKKGDATSFAIKKHNLLANIEKEGMTKFNALLKKFDDSLKNILNRFAKMYSLQTPKEDLQFQLSAVMGPESEPNPNSTQQDEVKSVIAEINKLVENEKNAILESEEEAIADTRYQLQLARDKKDLQILLKRKDVVDGDIFGEVDARLNRCRTGVSDALIKGERRMHKFHPNGGSPHKDEVEALISDWDLVVAKDGKEVKANWIAAQTDYYANITAEFQEFKNSQDTLALYTLSTRTDASTDILDETVSSSLRDFIKNLIELTNNINDRFTTIFDPPIDEPTVLTTKEIVARTILNIDNYIKTTKEEVTANSQELVLSLKGLLTRARLRHDSTLILRVLEEGDSFHFNDLKSSFVTFLFNAFELFRDGMNDIHDPDEDAHKQAVMKALDRWTRGYVKLGKDAGKVFQANLDSYMQTICDDFREYVYVDADTDLSYAQLVKRTDKYFDIFVNKSTTELTALTENLQEVTEIGQSRFNKIFNNGDEINTDGSISDIKSNAVSALEDLRDDDLSDLLQTMNDKHDSIRVLLGTAIDKGNVKLLLRETKNPRGFIYMKIDLTALGIGFDLRRTMTLYLNAVDNKFKTKYVAQLESRHTAWYKTVDPTLATLTAPREEKQEAYGKKMTELFNANLSKDDLSERAGKITEDFITYLNDYADKFIPAYKTLLTNYINSFKEILDNVSDSDAI